MEHLSIHQAKSQLTWLKMVLTSPFFPIHHIQGKYVYLRGAVGAVGGAGTPGRTCGFSSTMQYHEFLAYMRAVQV